MKFYDYTETLDMLNEVANEVGRDTKYDNLKHSDMPSNSSSVCFNAHMRPDGTAVPGCIVGQMVVRKLNVPAIELWGGETLGGSALSRADSHHLTAWLAEVRDVRFTAKAAFLLADVQEFQDGGYSWGDAIGQAANMMENRRFGYDDTK